MAKAGSAAPRPEGARIPPAGRRFILSERYRDVGQTYGALIALILLLFYNVAFTPNFLTRQTLNVNLTQVATIVIVATGMALVIATGGIDLSVGSLMAIAGALAPLIFLSPHASFSNHAVGVTLALILPVLAAGAFGLFNGFLVTHFKIQPIIATLVLFIAGRGIAQVVTNGNLQTFKNPGFQYIGLGRPFGIPFQVILMLVIVAVVAWVMRVTAFSRYVLAIGGNEPAARLAGVPVNRVKLAVYALSGLFSGIAGLIVIAINSSSDANLVGLNMELDAIAAVAVGGTPLTGGRVTIVGTLIGALIMQLIRYTLLANNVPDAAALVVKAIIIVIAVYVQRQRQA
jgi:simple sugar transport system permease protein/ribose transport system permease protein